MRRILGLSACVVTLVTLAACGSGIPSAEDGLIEQGSRIYVEDCLVCHGDARTGKGAVDNVPVHGPTGHTWHHPDGQLKEIILGTLDYPGKTMPPFAEKLTDGEIDAVLEYIKSNWESEQREQQEEVSRNWRELNRSKGTQ